MLKNISRLEVKVNNKDAYFHCEMDMPTTDVKEALFQFLKFIGQIEDNARALTEIQDKPLEAESPKEPEEKKV